ncbi:MAG TPA: nitrate reductase molybdenum cofactor assembly chaperone [Micromonosporaceae bacterium]|jgi:nitrate reductase delta subunit
MTRQAWRAVAARAASLLLRYPDADVLAAVPTIVAALPGLPEHVAGPLGHVADHRARTSPVELEASYVELFDLRRRCCLYLTWYTAGDTRRRGEALVGSAEAYRSAGLRVADEELPDFLPAVLDLAAHHDAGWRLLREHRVGVELLADALASQRSVYHEAVRAVLQMMPGTPRPTERLAAARLAAAGPPQELVGLEPYGVAR